MVAVGIDLGTTFSCVAWYTEPRAEVIQNQEGSRTTPSVVGFTEHEELVGNAARIEMGADELENIIYDAKRLIGRTSSDPSVIDDVKRYPFKVVQHPNMPPKYRICHNGVYTLISPEEVSKHVLSKLKQAAEEFIGKEVTDAVITVPAYFNSSQRAATITAGQLAGLNVLRIINEPTAAAIAYAIRKGFTEKKKILVYDLGGGTFDVSILEMNGGEINVLAVGGDTHLGGADLDERLFDHFADEVKSKLGAEVSNSVHARLKLREACEQTKRSLSTRTVAKISIEMLIQRKSFRSEITRAKFEALCADLFAKTADCVKATLRDAKLEANEVEEILLVGGSTRIPRVQQLIGELFPEAKISKSISPDEAVAEGAAIVAAKQSGVKSVELDGLVIRDVISLSLSERLYGNCVKTIIPRNSRIPIVKTSKSSNAFDHQAIVSFSIYQGERAHMKDNFYVGGCDLKIDTPKRKKENKFELTLEVDENGILKITARDTESGRIAATEVNYQANCLTRAEIDNAVTLANELQTQDEAERRRVKHLNAFRDRLYAVKHNIEDDKCKVSDLLSKPEMEAIVKREILELESHLDMSIAEMLKIEINLADLQIL